MAGLDIKVTGALSKIDPGDPLTALDQTYGQVIAKAEDAMGWYARSKRPKQLWAISLRLASIFFGGLTAITPMVINMLERNPKPLLPLGAVFGGVAATLIVFDKFFGFSEAWMRYATTYVELSARTDVFKLAWQRQQLELRAGPIRLDRVLAAHDLLAGFVASINDVVRAETATWVTQFKGNLEQVAGWVESQRAQVASAPRPPGKGGLKVRVEGFALFDEVSWKLHLGEGDGTTYSQVGMAVAANLAEGILPVRVSGTRGGKPFDYLDLALIQADKVTEILVSVT